MHTNACIIIVEIGNIFFMTCRVLSILMILSFMVYHGPELFFIAMSLSQMCLIETGCSDDDIFVVCVIIFDDD